MQKFKDKKSNRIFKQIYVSVSLMKSKVALASYAYVSG